MSEAGKRMIAGAIEMVEVARGEKPAVSIYHNGHRYVPESALSTAREEGRREGLEEAARRAEGWPTEEAGDQYQTCGNGQFWDAGTNYDQGRIDAAAAIRTLKEKQP